MTEQFGRYCSLTVEGVGWTMDLSEFRVRFDLHPLPLAAPAIGKILVTNLSPQRARALAAKDSEFKKITLDAGYEDGHGILFKGNIIQGIYGRESPTDTLLTIVAADGDHGHNNATVSTTHPAGSTPQDHFNTALSALGKFGITKGFIGVDLSTPVYPRAVTLYGMARNVLHLIAQNKNAMLFYDREEVTMIPRGGSRPDGAIVLNSRTGLIGMPTQTPDGIFARCLINPKIRRGSLVQINEKDIQRAVAEVSPMGDNSLGLKQLDAFASIATDGLYVVTKIDIFGDTRGQPWYMDLAMYAQGGFPSKAQLPYTGLGLASV